MPIHMRLPSSRGFCNRFRTEYDVVNVGDLTGCSRRVASITLDDLVDKAPCGRTRW